MQLHSDDQHSFDLRILGYQNSGGSTNDYDANWLSIEGRARHPRGAWTFQDPCLLTWKVTRLATWLDTLASGKVPEAALRFVEPLLAFRWICSGSPQMLQVHFAAEASPPWKTVGEENASFVEMPVSDYELRAAAQILRQELTNYPTRQGHRP